MDNLASPIQRLVEHFRKMPTIGRKTAQKLAFYISSLPKDEALDFANAIIDAKNKLVFCSVCQNVADSDVCPICSSDRRDKGIIMVVEDPRDVITMERMHEFNGTYHVLHGCISPVDGIGPDQIRIKELLSRISNTDISEIIMATNSTVAGEATSLYISRLLKPFNIKVTRIAFGIPVGGDIEYADDFTLLRAFEGRREI